MKKNLWLHRDNRGLFQKVVNDDFNVAEVYWSYSKQGVLRGLHFQEPPYECKKRVIVVSGCIIDVLVDLREGSSYGNVHRMYLGKGDCIEVPVGFAHGFYARGDSTLLYITDKKYSEWCDKGIAWDSVDWGCEVKDPILSERDKTFPRLEDYKTVFSGDIV